MGDNDDFDGDEMFNVDNDDDDDDDSDDNGGDNDGNDGDDNKYSITLMLLVTSTSAISSYHCGSTLLEKQTVHRINVSSTSHHN